MRKHFLILMLMALLPLAGFADDLSKGQMVIPSTYYGYAPNWSADDADYDNLPATDIKVYNKVNVLLKKGIDYTVDGFFSAKTCADSEKLTDAQVKAAAAGTIIYAKVTGMVAYEQPLVASFEIKKMPLTITVENKEKTFNNKGTEDTDETLGAITGISNLKQDGTDQDLAGDALTAMKNLLKVSRKAGKDVKYTTGNSPAVTGYDYVVTFKTANNNYEIKSVTGSFTIQPAIFPTTMGTENNTYKVTVTDNVKTYNGSAQQAKVTLVDNQLGYTLTANDYTVYYDGTTASALSQTNYEAAGYQISFKTKGNYTTQSTAVNLAIPNDPATANVDESKLNMLWIKQAELDIYVDDLKKTYDGTETFSGVTFSYSGLVGNDVTKEKPFGDNFEAEYASGAANSHIYEGKYLLKAKEKTSTNFNGTTYTNYNVHWPAFGQLTVEKRKVTITVSDSHKSYGTADPTDWTYTIQTKGDTNVPANEGALTDANTDIANKSDKELFAVAFNVIRNNASVETVGTYKESLELSAKSDDDLKAEISSWATGPAYTDTQVATMLAAIKKIFDQYTPVEKKGTFEIEKAGLTVAPAKKTITYGEEYDLADFDVIARNAAGDRIELTTKPTVKFKEAAFNEENPKDAGVYVLVLDGDIAADGYDGANATRNEGQFIIYKKKAQIILEDQHLMVGDYEKALLTNKVRFVDNASDPSKAKDVLVEGDVIGFKLKFNIGGETDELADTKIDTQDEADDWNANTGNLTNALDWRGSVPTTSGSTTTYEKFGVGSAMAANDYNSKVRPAVAVADGANITWDHIAAAKAYNATLTGAHKPGLLDGAVSSTAYAKGVTIEPVASTKDAPNQNANYDIAWTTGGVSPANTYFGKLYVVTNTGLALNSDDNDLANIQKLGANNTTVTTAITLDLNPRNAQKLPSTATANRIWDAKQWNTLVLPFDIEVADLSKAFGYAIVNVVDSKKTTTDNVAFKLYMDKIPANTPFLIKTAKKLVDATTTANGFTTDGVVTFAAAERTIKAPTEAQMEGVEAGMGYKFVPVYQTKTVDKTQSALRFLLGNYEKWAYILETSENTWDIVPFAAYVDLTPAGSNAREVTFTMQEADGSTTTIRSIDADGIDNNAADFAKGWYTINGMKLESAPAQKGIYIMNGKKVVIK